MKSILSSKAVWLNFITLLLGVLAMAQGLEMFQDLAPWLVFISGVLNLVLRVFFTSKPVTEYASTQS